MSKRQIILDFTSLLDVIMIILFFFVLYSKLETEDLQKELQAEKTAIAEEKLSIEQKNDAADLLLSEIEATKEAADRYLAEAEAAADRSGENVAGIMEFSKNANLKLKLQMNPKDAPWRLDIFHGEELIVQIPRGSLLDMTQAFKNAMSEAGYERDDTILCELFFDASENGTTSAYADITKLISQLQKLYTHFFYSETDTSIFNLE